MHELMRILLCLIMVMIAAEARELRIVTYNIHHGRGMDGKLDLNRIAEVIRKEKPEFVALQEVDVNVARSGKINEVKKLADLLGMHDAFGKTIDLQGGQYGNAVLSKFPIDKTSVHKLPGEGEARIVLQVDVKISGASLSFCSIHFDHRSEKARLLQAKALNARLHGIKHPVIVAGDFNATPEFVTMKLINKSWFIIPKTGSSFTMPANTPRSEIDYIITRNLDENKTTSRVIEEKVASDHRPVFGVVNLP
jgi:endonuclease/exonuclease/phosphatase family metal-dependent hydrolase